MRCSLQHIFAEHFDAYAERRRLHPRQRTAAWCIRHCYTASAGSHVLVCPQGHFDRVQYHACRHRSCPRCGAAARREWIEAQLQRLLPCPHFHVVFTLPHELIGLWSFNRAAMAGLLFDSARATLLALMADPRRAGVVPGLLMALHTWGRTLSRHPHVHCLLSAGGVDRDGQWRACSEKFLLPVKPLQMLFRGKLLAGLGALVGRAEWVLPPEQPLGYWRACIRGLYRRHWNVEIQPPYGHAHGVALYLARYVKGGPIPAERALSMDARGQVRLGYTDHRDGRAKTLCLGADEFIDRVLWHAPPKGVHCVRHAGLYSSALAEHHRRIGAELRPRVQPVREATWVAHGLDALALRTVGPVRCPTCQAVLVRCDRPRVRPREDGISIDRSSPPTATAVQPGPTGRSNGHSTAGRSPPRSYSRLRAAGC